ncbi:MAG: phage head-tail connector protein [Clostridia bacterium]
MRTELVTLRRRLGTGDELGDELFIDLLCDAENYVLAYTGRNEVPEKLRGVVIELAAMSYNRLGLQGESTHSEGGVSVAVDGLPENVRALLNRWRTVKVV